MTSCELNASFRLKSFLGFNEKKVSVESFVYSDFNYFYSSMTFQQQQIPSKNQNHPKQSPSVLS